MPSSTATTSGASAASWAGTAATAPPTSSPRGPAPNHLHVDSPPIEHPEHLAGRDADEADATRGQRQRHAGPLAVCVLGTLGADAEQLGAPTAPTSTRLWSAPARTGTWTRFAFDVHYSQYASQGSIKVYVDLNGDGDATDPGEQSPTFNTYTLKTETAGTNSDGIAAGESIPLTCAPASTTTRPSAAQRRRAARSTWTTSRSSTPVSRAALSAASRSDIRPSRRR